MVFGYFNGYTIEPYSTSRVASAELEVAQKESLSLQLSPNLANR
jgi:hypothetical protein